MKTNLEQTQNLEQSLSSFHSRRIIRDIISYKYTKNSLAADIESNNVLEGSGQLAF